MRAGIVVNVTRADRRQLEAIVSGRSAPQKHVWRANIILATAEGCGTAEIMRRSGKSKPVVWRFVDLQVAINRFVAETNADPKPFVWTADPKRVLAAVKRGKQSLESIH
jgi:hypothetical protein